MYGKDTNLTPYKNHTMKEKDHLKIMKNIN